MLISQYHNNTFREIWERYIIHRGSEKCHLVANFLKSLLKLQLQNWWSVPFLKNKSKFKNNALSVERGGLNYWWMIYELRSEYKSSFSFLIAFEEIAGKTKQTRVFAHSIYGRAAALSPSKLVHSVNNRVCVIHQKILTYQPAAKARDVHKFSSTLRTVAYAFKWIVWEVQKQFSPAYIAAILTSASAHSRNFGASPGNSPRTSIYAGVCAASQDICVFYTPSRVDFAWFPRRK